MPRLHASGALHRFKVLDLSQVRAGPTCVKQLADFGADVIKVEPPDSLKRQELYVGARDGSDMQNLHRNKRSITLDLKHPTGREILFRLVADADVVVENFRPDVKFRLKCDYESLSAVNPRIVLVSMSGFGQDGPYRTRPGFDQILQGMCGLMSVTGHADAEPVRAGASVVDMVTGLYAALGALTALLEREVSGRGQWVQASLLHCGIALMDYQAVRYAADGELPARVGNDHPTSMPTSAYKTRDGYINVAAGGDAQWRRLCIAIGQAALADHPDYSVNKARSQNRKALSALLAGAFAERDTATWMQLLSEADVPCGPIYTMDQVVDDPQVRHSKIFEAVEHPRRGMIPLIAQAAVLGRTPANMQAPLQDKGLSTDEILSALGYDASDIAELRRACVV